MATHSLSFSETRAVLSLQRMLQSERRFNEVLSSFNADELAMWLKREGWRWKYAEEALCVQESNKKTAVQKFKSGAAASSSALEPHQQKRKKPWENFHPKISHSKKNMHALLRVAEAVYLGRRQLAPPVPDKDVINQLSRTYDGDLHELTQVPYVNTAFVPLRPVHSATCVCFICSSSRLPLKIAHWCMMQPVNSTEHMS
jgi:hypothetical protein